MYKFEKLINFWRCISFCLIAKSKYSSRDETIDVKYLERTSRVISCLGSSGGMYQSNKCSQGNTSQSINVTETVSNRKAVVAMSRKREVPGSPVTYGTGPLACLSLFPVAELDKVS